MSERKLPRPDQEIYAEKKALEAELARNESADSNDRYLDILNNYDWSAELFTGNGKYGLKNWDGTLLLPARFDDFRMMSSALHKPGDRIVAIENGKEGIALMNGTNWSWVIAPEFDFVTYPSSIVGLKKDGHWGIYNITTGKYLMDHGLDELFLHGGGFMFVNGIGVFRKGEKYGVINENGEVSRLDFDEVSMDFDGLLRVRKDDKWGYVNEDGKFEEDEDLAYWGWEV